MHFTWTDSTTVLGWLIGSPKRNSVAYILFKPYIVDQILPDQWSHISSEENHMDCASRSLLTHSYRKTNYGGKVLMVTTGIFNVV